MGFPRFSFLFLVLLSISAWATVPVNNNVANIPAVACTPNDINSSCLQGSGGITNLTPNVGIGSSAPGQALDVQGSIRAIQYFGDGSKLTGISSGGSGNVGIGTVNLVSEYVGIGTLGPTASLYAIGNNIGIGSITPGQALDITGTVRATQFLGDGSKLSGINSSNFWLLGNNNVGISTFGNGNNVGIGTTTASNQLVIGTTGQSIFTTSGNLGINMTPTTALGVTGTENIVAPVTNLLVNPTFAGASNPITPPTSWGVGQNGSGGTLTLSGTSITFNTTASSDMWLCQQLSVTSGATYNLSITVTTATNVQPRPLVGSACGQGQYLVHNYPNGTTGTLTDSFVASTSSVYYSMYALGVTGTEVLTFNSPSFSLAPSSFQALSAGGSASIGLNYASNTPPNGGLIVQGNVGIGSIVPGQALDVFGTTRSTFFSGNGSTLTQLAASPVNSIQYNVGGNLTGSSSLIFTGTNVGIGSTVPGSQLDVNGNVRALSGGTCTTLYKCNSGVDAGVIQTSACVLCPGGSCSAMNGCF